MQGTSLLKIGQRFFKLLFEQQANISSSLPEQKQINF